MLYIYYPWMHSGPAWLIFLDPHGNIMPCNGSDEPMIMGNLKDQTFDEIWNSQKANKIRNQVRNCTKQCWMIGSASPAMKKRVWVPAKLVAKNKLMMIRDRGAEICLDRVGE